MLPLTGLAYVALSESPSLRYFESASREARRSLGEVWWGRADRRSETKSGREGVQRFCERHMVLPILSAHPVHDRETSCFAELFGWQNDRHHAARFAFLLSAHPWALKLSALLPFPLSALVS